jgi:hypothetical protein
MAGNAKNDTKPDTKTGFFRRAGRLVPASASILEFNAAVLYFWDKILS